MMELTASLDLAAIDVTVQGSAQFQGFVSDSFVLASPLNTLGKSIYRHWHDGLVRYERSQRLPGDEVFNFYAEVGSGFAEHVWERLELRARG